MLNALLLCIIRLPNKKYGERKKMKRIYGIQSALGGQDFYDDSGGYVGSSVPGILGGEDYYWANGETGFTVDSVINGQDYYGSDGSRVSSVDSVVGYGQDFYGDVSGFSVDSVFGGSDIFIDE